SSFLFKEKGRRARSLRFIRPQTSSITTICALKLRPTHAYLLNWKSVLKDNQIYFPPKVVNSVDDRSIYTLDSAA
ncbi:hypothetical protein Avbf_13245, partial [Armadillidium vulgare]